MMIPKINEKPTMVIAGPGAGKTHDMVDRIVEALPSLKPNRFLAAITFTNAATDSIKKKLQNLIQIPPNVFIGTNYSFFNKFILLPFATLFDYISLDKLFLEIDIKKIVDRQCKKRSNYKVLNAARSNIVKKLLKEGKVPFEQISIVSAKLMENTRVRDVVCNRIQFLFIDEFQDTDIVQLKIFDAIRKGKKTHMYSVGDPEQYIMGFIYNLRGIKKPTFNKIPINRFVSDCKEDKICINRRASTQLVQFTKIFHTTIKQISKVGPVDHSGVFYLCCTDLDAVISNFIELTKVIENVCKNPRRLFLGYENKTFDALIEKYGLVPISNDNKGSKTILGESLELISSVVQLSSKSIRERYDMDVIDYRKLGIKLINAFISEEVRTTEELISFIENDLKLNSQNGYVNLDLQLKRLVNLLCQYKSFCGNNFYTSIHKAKGLEAESVLVVAKNKNELERWLTTNIDERCQDKNDTCRIGYVGFTRAKYILCIACKQFIDNQVKTKLRNCGVQIIG